MNGPSSTDPPARRPSLVEEDRQKFRTFLKRFALDEPESPFHEYPGPIGERERTQMKNKLNSYAEQHASTLANAMKSRGAGVPDKQAREIMRAIANNHWPWVERLIDEYNGRWAPEAEVADPTAFRPAKEFLGEQIPSYKALRKILDANSWIRRQKPSKHRLLIHAGDMHKYLSQAQVAPDPLDLPAEAVAEAVHAVEERKAQERAKSGR